MLLGICTRENLFCDFHSDLFLVIINAWCYCRALGDLYGSKTKEPIDIDI